MKTVLVTTEHRGVFIGQMENPSPEITECTLHDAVMAIHWGTTKGVAELAATGPTSKTRLSARVPKWHLRGIVSVVECTDEAAAKYV